VLGEWGRYGPGRLRPEGHDRRGAGGHAPAQRRAHFQQSIVRDLSTLPLEYLEQLRARSLDLIARRDAEQAAQSRDERGMSSAS
jgi:hypothetical protein